MRKSILKQMAEGEAKDAEKSKTAKPVRQRRMGSPVVGNVSKALTNLSADTVISINPEKIDPSPFRDRFETDADAKQALEDLRVSLSDEGQKIPVLVRPHPTVDGRYQLAYGHRRTAALKALHTEAKQPETVRVRAYVREMTDAELIKEQSLENTVRENLSFIETAFWARQLKSTGINNRSMAPILGIPESGVSRLITISERIPDDIVHAIGRAKDSGRRRWAALADVLVDAKAETRVRGLFNSKAFLNSDGDTRISIAISAAKGNKKRIEDEKPKAFDLEANGIVFAKVKQSAGATTVTLPKNETEFASWLIGKMKDLRAEYLAATGKKSE